VLFRSDPSKRVRITITNWNGAALKIPRDMVRASSQERRELERTGIYMLFGQSAEEPGKPMVYLGQSGALKSRLVGHLASKDWWDECLVYISTDGALNTGHTRYLESTLIRAAKIAGKYVVTQNEPSDETFDINEQDRAQMDEFVDYVKLITQTVGHKVFEHDETSLHEGEPVFVISNKLADGTPYEAKGRKSLRAQFEILGGSVANKAVSTATCFLAFAETRKKVISQLLQQNILVDKANSYEFTTNYKFPSATYAAMFVLGRNVGGLQEWKCGQLTLRDYEKEQNKVFQRRYDET
jgi:hypothetical protein